VQNVRVAGGRARRVAQQRHDEIQPFEHGGFVVAQDIGDELRQLGGRARRGRERFESAEHRVATSGDEFQVEGHRAAGTPFGQRGARAALVEPACRARPAPPPVPRREAVRTRAENSASARWAGARGGATR
jgi:hypothetical protein